MLAFAFVLRTFGALRAGTLLLLWAWATLIGTATAARLAVTLRTGFARGLWTAIITTGTTFTTLLRSA